jgi:outer membrane protein assembly factor BamB
MRFQHLLTLCLPVFLCSSLVAEETNPFWPQFRGPTGQGISQAKSVPTEWGEEKNILWKTPLPGEGWSSPSVVGDEIWLTAALDAGKDLRAICVSLDSGEVLQNVKLFELEKPQSIHKKNSHASPSVVIDGDYLYAHFGAHGTACLTRSGKIVWKQQLDYNHVHGPGGSPVVVGDLLVVNVDGSKNQRVVAFDKKTGETKWTTPRAHISEARKNGDKQVAMAFSTPLVYEDDKGRTLVLSVGSDHVSAYEAETGKEVWWCEYDGYSTVPRPVIAGGMTFLSCGYDRPILYGIELGGEGNVTETHTKWTLDRGAPLNPSPLAIGNELYIVSDNGVAQCLDLKTGESHWKERIPGNFSASPFLAGGLIYFTNEIGRTTIIKPGKEYQEVVSNQLDGRTLATPTPLEGTLLIRTDKALYRIGAK